MPVEKMLFKNSRCQCFIPVLTGSNTSLSQSHPRPNARGGAKYRNHFPYFFSSAPGPLPSISFSHHANWQKLVPFVLFIYLAETACSLYGTTSQNCVKVSACLFHFNVTKCIRNVWKRKAQKRKFGRMIWCPDAYLWTWWSNGMSREEETQLPESKLKWRWYILKGKNCPCDKTFIKTGKVSTWIFFISHTGLLALIVSSTMSYKWLNNLFSVWNKKSKALKY